MTAVAAPPLGYRAVLRVAGLRSVFVAHAVSMAGSVATEVALSILIFQRTGSALLSALVLVCLFLPYALGGSVLSSIADRFPARRVLVCCDLLCATCVAAMLIPGIPVLALLGLLLVTGIVAPVFQGARAASLAHLLDADTFPVGRSLLRAISQTTVLAGFAIGSVMVAAVGPTWLLAADVTSFLASAVLIGLRSPDTPAHAPDRDRSIRAVLRASTTGLRYVFTNRPLRRLILLFWSVPAFASVVHGLAVAYTAQINASPTAAGALFTGCAAGTVFGELAVTRLPPPTRRRLVLPLVLTSQLPAMAFIATPPVPIAALLVVLSGAGFAFSQGLDPLILAATAPAYRGRLFTVQGSGLMAVQGIGIALAGIVGTFSPVLSSAQPA
jgi:predicted MFS family arabinose efflux permease